MWLRHVRRAGGAPEIIETGDGLIWMRVFACSLFYRHFRLHATIETIPVFGAAAVTASAQATARLLIDGAAPMQTATCRRIADGLEHEVRIEALVDPARFPGDGFVEIGLGDKIARRPLGRLLLRATFDNLQSLVHPFRDEIVRWITAHRPARPSLLDIGGRARSGVQRSEHYPQCDVTTFDIVTDAGVDVVGDAHEMSRHFAPASFDFATSVSVFEHLIMPWKVVLEMNRVLKPGGMAFIFTHQTIGMHDMPWDFFRFSKASWTGLFNRYTGFEVVHTNMSQFMHIVPRAWSERFRGSEASGGYNACGVIVRKTGAATVGWQVPVAEILRTAYPGAPTRDDGAP
jgi:hypothetical protein